MADSALPAAVHTTSQPLPDDEQAKRLQKLRASIGYYQSESASAATAVHHARTKLDEAQRMVTIREQIVTEAEQAFAGSKARLEQAENERDELEAGDG